MGTKEKEKPEGQNLVLSEQTKEVSEYQSQKLSVESMIMTAIKQKVDPTTMERFLLMRKELKAEYAKEQFDQAMAKFQMECPEIKKTKHVKNNSGKELYAYAPIDEIVRQAKEAISRNGLNYTIKTETRENDKKGTLVKSICIVKHIAGHSEESSMEVPLGNKTDIMSNSQVIAAAATFSKRYAFCNAFGIMTGDEDKEENLKDAPANEIGEAIGKINKCMTVDALVKTWSGFSKEIKANKEVILQASNIKKNIQNENSQTNNSKVGGVA